MNTRIEGLIKQAEETYTYKDFDGDGFEEIKQGKMVNLEKFAELIINECVNAVEDSSECFTFEQTYVKALALNSLKARFGVE